VVFRNRLGGLAIALGVGGAMQLVDPPPLSVQLSGKLPE
jgi:hypothetical protein